LPGDDGIGRVGGDGRERVPKLLAQIRQPGGIAGDADDVRSGLGQCGGDATAEAPAGAGDQCGCS